MTEIPDGFVPLGGKSPFINWVGPFYCHETDGSAVIGLLLEDRHCNNAGTVHGGLISTMADVAMAKSIAHARLLAGGTEQSPEQAQSKGSVASSGYDPIVSINLSTDFAGSARTGEWLEMRVDIQRMGGTLQFASAYLHCNGERIARSSGVFRVLSSSRARRSGNRWSP